MAQARCGIEIRPRQRVVGAEATVSVRLDRSATIELIRSLAASISMRVTLAPVDPAGNE